MPTITLSTEIVLAEPATNERERLALAGFLAGYSGLKGGKVVTVPLAPRTARAIDLAIGERSEGPLFHGPDGERLDRHGAARIVRRVTRRAGITKPVGPHTLRHAFITAGQMSDVAGTASFGMVRDQEPIRQSCPPGGRRHDV
jgi:integrase